MQTALPSLEKKPRRQLSRYMRTPPGYSTLILYTARARLTCLPHQDYDASNQIPPVSYHFSPHRLACLVR